MPSRSGKHWLAAVLGLSLASTSTLAVAAPVADPSSANAKRAAAQEQAKALDDGEAANLFVAEARLHKDPILFIEAATALERKAKAESDTAAAEACQAHATSALDMLYFLDTTADSPNWQPLLDGDLASAIDRAEGLVSSCKALADGIAADAAAPPPPPPEDEKRKSAAGTGFLIGGGVALGLGVVGLALGTAGLAIGAQAQDDVTDPTIVDPSDHADAEQSGKVGNGLAYAGFIVGGIGVGAGVALLVIGLKRRKAARGGDEQAFRPMLLPTTNGVVLTGRF